MIRHLRQYQNTLVVSLITTFVAVGMLLWGVERIFLKTSSTPSSANVNQVDLGDIVNQILANADRSYAELTDIEKQQLTQYASTILQQEMRLSQYAQSLQLHIHSQVLAETLSQNGLLGNIQDALAYHNKQPNPQAMQQLQARVNRMQRQSSHQLLISALRSSLISLPEESSSVLRANSQTRRFAWTSVPMSATDLSTLPKPTQAEIDSYYDKTPFLTKSTASVDYIRFPAAQFESAAPKLSDLRTFLENHPGEFDTPKQYHYKRFKLVEPSNKHSVHKVSTQFILDAWGVDDKPNLNTEWLYYEDTAPVAYTESAIPHLSLLKLRPNQYTIAPDSDGSIYLYKFTHITAKKTCTLNNCRQAIQDAWSKHQTHSSRAALITSLQDEILYNPDDLTSLANIHSAHVHTSPVFYQDSGHGVAQSAAFRAAGFAKNLHDSHQLSDPVTLEDGAVVVLRARKLTSPTKIPLSTVQNDIVETLRKQNSQRNRQLELEESLAGLRNNQNIDQFCKRWDSQVTQSDFLHVDSANTLPEPIARMAFTLSSDAIGWNKVNMLPDYQTQTWFIFALTDVDYPITEATPSTSSSETIYQLEVNQLFDKIA
ncbi:MAG: hypothetical protein VX112_02325 [Pseudomonadota bacterium]|nr:hypothetical protein [Pseudomonadota bacterium]